MRSRIVWTVAVLAFCAAVLSSSSATAAPPAKAAVAAPTQTAPIAAFTDADIRALEGRETHAAPLAEYRGGDAEVATTIAAWTGAGFGITAFILALIAL